MKRKLLYSIFLLQFLISGFLFADSVNEIKQYKTFSWRVNPKARKYQVEIIQKQPSGEWKSFLVEETQETYLEALLPQGEYRTSLSVFNIYGVKVSTSTIETFKIQNKNKLIPYIYDDMDSLDVWNDSQTIFLNKAAENETNTFFIKGENIFFEDTRVYLEPKDASDFEDAIQIQPTRRAIVPLEIIYRDTQKKFIQVEYDYELLSEGYYNIVVVNPNDYFVATEIIVLEDETVEIIEEVEQILPEEALFEEIAEVEQVEETEEVQDEVLVVEETSDEEDLIIEENLIVVENIEEETPTEEKSSLEAYKYPFYNNHTELSDEAKKVEEEPKDDFKERVEYKDIEESKKQRTKALFPFLNIKLNIDSTMFTFENVLRMDAGLDFDILDLQWIVLEGGVKYFYREYEQNGFFVDAAVRFAIPSAYFEPYIGVGAMYNVFDLTNISKNPMAKFRVEAFAGLLLVSHIDLRWNFVYDFPPNFADIQNYSASSLSVGFKIPLSPRSSKIVQKSKRRAEIYVNGLVDGSSYKNIPNVVEIKIAERATAVQSFTKNKNIRKVELGPDVSEINPNCFADCKNLSTVILNDKLRIIGSNAFSYTTKIKELVIPSSVYFIGKDAFEGWASNQKIILDWPSTEYKKLEGLKGIDAKVYYNDGKRYKYKK